MPPKLGAGNRVGIEHLIPSAAFALSSAQNHDDFAELGFPSLTQVAWVGLGVAPDVPAAVQDKLRSETLRIEKREDLVVLPPELAQPLDRQGIRRHGRLTPEKQRTCNKGVCRQSASA